MAARVFSVVECFVWMKSQLREEEMWKRNLPKRRIQFLMEVGGHERKVNTDLPSFTLSQMSSSDQVVSTLS